MRECLSLVPCRACCVGSDLGATRLHPPAGAANADGAGGASAFSENGANTGTVETATGGVPITLGEHHKITA